MKKKLVAFAVTAAMVVTSAVPVFAVWEPSDKVDMPTANAVVLDDANDLKGGIENTYNESISADKSYDVNVDMLRTSGIWEIDLTLRGTNGDLYHYVANFDNDGVWKYGNANHDGNPIEKSITTFSWNVDTANGFVFLNVDEKGTSAGVEDYLRWDLGSVEPVTVVSVEVRPWASATNTDYHTVVYQNAVPTKVTDVKIVKADPADWSVELDKYDREQVVDQVVKGEAYRVESITFDDGTEVSIDEMLDYADLTWKATDKNGNVTVIDTGSGYIGWDGRYINLLDNTYEGCYITLEVKGNQTSGIFRTYTWGGDMNPLAIYDRLAGANRYETAMLVADQMDNAGNFTKIFVATGTNYADALSVTALANAMNAPILLVNSDYEDEVKAYIDQNTASYAGTTVYIVGGTNAVSAEFEDSLGQYNVDVERIAGETRYDTNIKVMQEYDALGVVGADPTNLDNILVASGTNYPDALSAAATGKPVLLVGTELTREQRSYLHGLTRGGHRTYDIIGGRNAVSDDIKDELSETDLYDATVTRTGGADRYETNQMVMAKYNNSYDSALNMSTAKYAFVATGMDYADALTGGVLAAQNHAPLVLVNQNNIDAAQDTIDAVKASPNYVGLVVIGGENAVSNATVQKIA